MQTTNILYVTDILDHTALFSTELLTKAMDMVVDKKKMLYPMVLAPMFVNFPWRNTARAWSIRYLACSGHGFGHTFCSRML